VVAWIVSDRVLQCDGPLTENAHLPDLALVHCML